MANLLSVKNLFASIGSKEILKGVNIEIKPGEVHVIMGPNGSGKSTFANVLMGNPRFHVTRGEMLFLKKNILDMDPEERAWAGLFMAFQYPREISGVQFDRFLFTAYSNLMKSRSPNAMPTSVFEFKKKLTREMELLKLKPELSERSVNEGFSGGEKKKMEMLQLLMLEPTLAILDETDSGLDVDALKIVGSAINRFRNPHRSVLIVTHYQRILDSAKPDFIHIMIDGKIVTSGDGKLAKELEKKGYEQFMTSNK